MYDYINHKSPNLNHAHLVSIRMLVTVLYRVRSVTGRRKRPQGRRSEDGYTEIMKRAEEKKVELMERMLKLKEDKWAEKKKLQWEKWEVEKRIMVERWELEKKKLLKDLDS